MKGLLKLISISILSGIAIILLLALSFLYAPQFIFNNKTLHIAQKYLNLPIRYDNAEIEVQNVSALEKKLFLNFSNLCYQNNDDTVSTCADDMSFGFTILFTKKGITFTEAGPINIQGRFFRGDFSKLGKARQRVSQLNTRNLLPEKLNDFKIQNIYVNLKNIEVKIPNSEAPVKGDLVLSKVKSVADGVFNLNSQDFNAHFEVSNRAKSDLLKFKGSVQKTGELQSKLFGQYDYLKKHGESNFDLTLSSIPLIRAHLDVFLASESIDYTLDTHLELKDKTKISSQWKGNYTSKEVAGVFTGEVFWDNEHVILGDKGPCQYRINFERFSNVQCDAKYFFTINNFGKNFSKSFKAYSDTINLKTTGHFDGPVPLSKESPLTGKVNLFISKPSPNQIFDFKGEVSAFFDKYRISNPWVGLRVKENLNITVNHFKEFAKALRKTRFQIPAPFNALDGTLKLSSQGEMSSTRDEFPFVLTTDLAGPNQFMKVQSLLKLGQIINNGNHIPSLHGDIILEKVQLSLPRFEMSKPPPFVPDSRIQSLDLEPENQFLIYSLNIRTAVEPLRLISNLTEEPIPLKISFNVASGTQILGRVDVEAFAMKLFRRQAQIKYLNAIFKSSRADENPVSGEIIVPFSDFTVQIHISGTEKHTAIKLTSDPSYSESQILAAVLFGKSPNSLDSNLDADQATSVGNTQAAIADKALSVSSFFLLASTPVEAVGYDSQAGMLTAKVKIQDGVSLDFGANTNQLRELGLNKRLGKSWYLRTYITNPVDPAQNQSVTAFLEKLFRY